MECSNVSSIASTRHFKEIDTLSLNNTFIGQFNIKSIDKGVVALTEKVENVFQTANKEHLCVSEFCVHDDHFEVCFPSAGYAVKVMDRSCRKPFEEEVIGLPAKDPYLSYRPKFELAPDRKSYLSINALQEDYLPFHYAILEPDSDLYFVLREFRDNKDGGDINQIDADGNNALHMACLSKKWDLVFDLIDSGCNPAQRNGFGDSPLDILSRNEEMEDELFISILEKLPDITVANTVLHNTLSTTIADYLLEKHISIDTLNANGHTPLIAAIKNSTRQAKSGGACYDYIEHLCKNNGDLKLGLPFHQIVMKHDNLDFFELLMEYGGNINQVDRNGDNALMLACEAIPIYQEKDVKKDEGKDEYNLSILFNKYQIFIEDLLEFGCDFITPNKFGIIPLVTIAENQFISNAMMLFLLKQDIKKIKARESDTEKSVNAVKKFLTPLLPIMHITQCEEIINLFLGEGFSIDSFDKTGRSLLFSAVEGVDILLAQYLIDNGADPSLVNPNTTTQITKNLKNCSPISPLTLLCQKIATHLTDVITDNTLCYVEENTLVQPCTIYKDPLDNQLFSVITELISQIDETKLKGANLSTFHLLLVLKNILSFQGSHL
ncbi:MAG: hypothetical protein H0T62_13000 [Parachlamydiaceae bacterium]|nr:hypothetical protein [Parachlamydiaceae bacterium]